MPVLVAVVPWPVPLLVVVVSEPGAKDLTHLQGVVAVPVLVVVVPWPAPLLVLPWVPEPRSQDLTQL